MKRIFVAFASFILSIGTINFSFACDFLKEKIETPMTTLTEKYDLLNDPTVDPAEPLTFVNEYDSFDFCENIELENSTIKVFVREGKIIGTKIFGGYGEASTNKIFNFANSTLGFTTQEVLDENWIGGVALESFGGDVIYGRVSDAKGNYETLTITKPELKEFMFGPDVIEDMM
tara:strand:- start:91 stop:612 length:522 start_codon:yes stop_codon:yes gene_type:complete